jgi:hypothetical protein
MRPPGEGDEGHAREQQQRPVNSGPPAQAGNPPEFHGGDRQNDQTQGGTPAHQMRRGQPGIHSVTDERNVLVH